MYQDFSSPHFLQWKWSTSCSAIVSSFHELARNLARVQFGVTFSSAELLKWSGIASPLSAAGLRSRSYFWNCMRSYMVHRVSRVAPCGWMAQSGRITSKLTRPDNDWYPVNGTETHDTNKGRRPNSAVANQRFRLLFTRNEIRQLCPSVASRLILSNHG